MATDNADKAAEIAAILGDVVAGVEVIPRPEGLGEVEETADTLEGNARLKARAVMAFTW